MKFISEENYENSMKTVCAELDKIAEPGTFARKEGEDIYYELYNAENPKGWVVISHGFTESTVKYAEIIWYFLQAGYSVAMPDHRGHGRSFRDVKENWLTNVDHFEDYRDDIIYLIKEIVVPAAEGKPIYLMGHSMGGAVAAHVAEYAPELPIAKLILCSPMIMPATGNMSENTALLIARIAGLFGRGRKNVPNHHPFDPAGDWGQEWCCANSEARYKWYLEVQKARPEFQNSAATYNWLRESILQSRYVLNPENAARVKIPILLLQGSKDTMVRNDAQNKLVELLPNARKVVFPGARHEIFRGNDKDVKNFMNMILGFIH